MKRWAVVTGAAGGVGQALVDVFSSNAYSVIAVDKQQKPAELPCAHYLIADLERTVQDEVYANDIFDQLRTLIGNDDLCAMLNNAAVQVLGNVDNLTREDWRVTLDVNLIAPFLWAQALLPLLERNCGGIVNISSIHATQTKRGFVAYATSKAALSGLTRSMAVDLEDRVRVNAIAPAAIDTEMLRLGFSKQSVAYQNLRDFHPAKRLGDAGELAVLAFDIATGRYPFLHGTVVEFNGGIGARLHDPT